MTCKECGGRGEVGQSRRRSKRAQCGTCRGTGSMPLCAACSGSGYVGTGIGSGSLSGVCPQCQGRGTTTAPEMSALEMVTPVLALARAGPAPKHCLVQEVLAGLERQEGSHLASDGGRLCNACWLRACLGPGVRPYEVEAAKAFAVQTRLAKAHGLPECPGPVVFHMGTPSLTCVQCNDDQRHWHAHSTVRRCSKSLLDSSPFGPFPEQASMR